MLLKKMLILRIIVLIIVIILSKNNINPVSADMGDPASGGGVAEGSSSSTSTASSVTDYPDCSTLPGNDAERCRVTSSGVNINRYGTCKNIRKVTGDDPFIPLKTHAEWQSFISWALNPSNNNSILITNCASSPTPTGGSPASGDGTTTFSGPGGGGGSCPFLFAYKDNKYFVENDVMLTYKHQDFETAKTAYENNSGNPLKTRQTDLYKMRLIPDTTPEGLRLMVKEIEPEESHVDQVKLIRAVTAKGNNLFVDNQAMAITAVGPVKTVGLTNCSLADGQNCLKELSSIDAHAIEGNAGSSMSIRFDLKGLNKKNLYLSINSWINDPPQIQTEAFKANAQDDADAGAGATTGTGSSSMEGCGGGGGSLTVRIMDADGSSAKNLTLKDFHPRELAIPNSVAIGDLIESKEDALTIKIDWTARHMVDHIGLFEASPVEFTTEELPLTKAVSSTGEDVLEKLLNKDKVYVDLVRGDSVELIFTPSEKLLKEGEEEVYFFASSGFYHGLRTYLHPKADPSMDSYRKELQAYVDELKKL